VEREFDHLAAGRGPVRDRHTGRPPSRRHLDLRPAVPPDPHTGCRRHLARTARREYPVPRGAPRQLGSGLSV